MATSYDNPGGTGDRTATIAVTATAGFDAYDESTVTDLVNGIKDGAAEIYFAPDYQYIAGLYIQFDFGAGASKVISETKWYLQNSTTQAVWKWQGSDNGTDWSVLSANFTLGGATTWIDTSMSANISGYRYYRMLGVSGYTRWSTWIYEVEFKIADSVKIVTDTLALSETATISVEFARISTDTLSLEETSILAAIWERDSLDAISLSEDADRVRVRNRSSLDGLELSEEASVDVIHLILDTITLVDTAVVCAEFVRISSDLLALNGVASFEAIFNRVSTDSLSLVDAAAGVVSKERTSTDALVLSEEIGGDLIHLTSDPLTLSDMAVSSVDHTRISSDGVVVDELVGVNCIFNKLGEDTLTLSESATTTCERFCGTADVLNLGEVVVGDYYYFLADTLVLCESVVVEVIHACVDSLSLNESAICNCVRFRHSHDQITILSDSAWPGFYRLDATDVLQIERISYDPVTFEAIVTYEGLQDRAEVFIVSFTPKVVADHLSFAEVATGIKIRADAVPVDATDTLSLSDTAYSNTTPIANDLLILADVADVVSSKLLEDTIELVDNATCSLVRNLAVSDSIELSESLAWYNRLEDCIWVYHPFVGTGAAGAPTPPPETLTGPMPGITAPFQLVYPATGVVTDSVTLCSPNLGNRDQLVFNRILRETRGGTTISFADPIWPKVQTQVLNFSGLTRNEAQDLLDFFTDHLGVEVGMIDWEQRYWRGIIVTPEDPIIEDSFNNYSASFNFEGALDETWSPQAIPWIPGTPLRRIRHDYESLNPAEPEPPEEMPDDAFNAEADSTMLAGTPVYVKSNGHIDAAKADDLPASGAIGLLYADVSAGHTGYYLTEGRVTRTNWTLITGTDLLTPGEMYFISTATAGRLVTTAPTSGYVVRAARATSTQTLDIEVEEPIRL